MRWTAALLAAGCACGADWPVRELARKLGPGEFAIEVTGPDAAAIRAALGREVRMSATAAAAVTVAAGESWREWVLAAEIRTGDERRYVVASAPKAAAAAPAAAGIAIEKTLLRSQPERMLDAVETAAGLYVLEPGRVVGPMGERKIAMPPSRDPRGRLSLNASDPAVEPSPARDEAVIPHPCGGELRLTTLDTPFDQEDAVEGGGASTAFGGPVLALHAHGATATAIVRELSTGAYAAYRITAVCRR